MNQFFFFFFAVFSLSSSASTFRELTPQEINLANWISRCPNEYAELSKLSDQIGSGSFFMDHVGRGFTFYFKNAELAVGSLQIAQFNGKPGFRCKISKN